MVMASDIPPEQLPEGLSPHAALLIANRFHAQGEPVRINYGLTAEGGLSTQQLLFNFGQVIDDNPNAKVEFYWQVR